MYLRTFCLLDFVDKGCEDSVDDWCVQAKAVFVDFITKMDLPKRFDCVYLGCLSQCGPLE